MWCVRGRVRDVGGEAKGWTWPFVRCVRRDVGRKWMQDVVRWLEVERWEAEGMEGEVWIERMRFGVGGGLRSSNRHTNSRLAMVPHEDKRDGGDSGTRSSTDAVRHEAMCVVVERWR